MTSDDYSISDMAAWCEENAVGLAAAATQWEIANPGAAFGEFLRAKLYPPAPVQPAAEHDDGMPRAPRPDLSQASGGNGRSVRDPVADFAGLLDHLRRR